MIDAPRERFMHVVDARAEFVEALAAEFGERLVELDGQMFELLIEALKAVVRFRGDDRTDRLDDLPHILAAGALRAPPKVARHAASDQTAGFPVSPAGGDATPAR